MLKGFGRDFHPSKGQVHVWLKMDGPDEARVNVRLSHLKAVFFVHDFEGGPRSDAAEAAVAAAAGRRVVVAFLDGEVLDATTLNYAAEAPGFFVSPLDPSTNNQRIFVINEAVRHVQFP
jgi:hypothetical protein